MTHNRAFAALLGVELRRTWPLMVRLTGATGLMLLMFWISGNGTAENVGVVLCGMSIAHLFTVPMAALKDRLDGGMEFVCTLPVLGSVIAGARLAAAAISVTAGAAQVAAAVGWVVMPALGLEDPTQAQAVVVSFFGAWFGFSALTCLALGAVMRFEFSTLRIVPPLFGVGIVLAAATSARLAFDDPAAAARRVLELDAAPYLLLGTMVLIGVGGIAAGFHLARKGAENFRPTPDALTW